MTGHLRTRFLVIPLALVAVASLTSTAGASTWQQRGRDRRPRSRTSSSSSPTTWTSNFFVTDSLCCPSRSSILRGQYVHQHDVLGNLPPSGGYGKFHTNGDEKSTVATWMHDSGHRTGLLGKYLNGYPESASSTTCTPTRISSTTS